MLRILTRRGISWRTPKELASKRRSDSQGAVQSHSSNTTYSKRNILAKPQNIAKKYMHDCKLTGHTTNSSPRVCRVISRGWFSSSAVINSFFLQFHSFNTSTMSFLRRAVQSEIDRSKRAVLSWHWFRWASIFEIKPWRWAATCDFILFVISVSSAIYREKVAVTDNPDYNSVTLWFCI